MQTLYYNGRFWSGENWLNETAGILVNGNRIESLLSKEALNHTMQRHDLHMIDLNQQNMYPGFWESHIHIWKLGNLMRSIVDLRSCNSVNEICEALQLWREQHPDAKWIVGRGFNEALFDNHTMPVADDFGKLGDGINIFIVRTCAHIAVVNAAALRQLEKYVDALPPGGKMGRDALGRYNGRLYETALNVVYNMLPKMSDDVYMQDILVAQDSLWQEGYRYATDPSVSQRLFRAFENLNRQSSLKLHIELIPDALDESGSPMNFLQEPYSDRKLSARFVKFFADGGLSGKTAALSRNYKNDDGRGWLRMTDDLFLNSAMRFASRGFGLATHAIGDLAIEQTLKVYRKIRKHFGYDILLRIEHLGLPSETHLQEIYKLGIKVVSQPVFITELGKNFLQYLDDTYLRQCYPFKSMLDHGIDLAFSSDAPVVKDFSIQGAIKAAALREVPGWGIMQPSEALSAEDVYKAYTLNGAIAHGYETFRGKLEKNYEANFSITQ
ncbi:MAG: amidohydrolase family protein [Cyclobacteriaceae bacterium]|nr:amidohydrolase family protein [Cyclobacteriaceae bacterium]